MTVQGSVEFDSSSHFNVSIANAGKEDIALGDVRLVLPVRRAAAPYMMGLAKQGGYSADGLPVNWRWSIDPTMLVKNK